MTKKTTKIVRGSYYRNVILPNSVKLTELFSFNTELKYPKIYNLATS